MVLAAAPATAQSDEDKPGSDTQLGASFVGSNGNAHISTVGVDMSTTDRRPPWKFEAAFNAVRSATRDALGIDQTLERYLENARIRRKISKLLSVTAGERLEHDPVAGMELRSIVDAGLGWKLADRPDWSLDAITALAWNHEHPVTAVASVDRDDPVGLFQLLNKVALGKTGSTTQRFTAYPDFRDTALSRLEGELTAQAAMNARLALKLGFLIRYVNTPLPGLKSTDTTATASIVFTWKTPPPPAKTP